MTTPAAEKPAIDLSSFFTEPLPRKVFALVGGAVEKALAIDVINQIYAQASSRPDDRHFLDKVLDVMKVGVEVADGDLARIPSAGRLVVVANHPFGGLEGVVLGALLRSSRPDTKLMANFILKAIPALHDAMIFVDPFDRDVSARINLRPIKECVRWLKDEHVLGVFPSGTVSHMDLRRGGIADPEWNTTIARLIRMTQAPVLPVFFSGSNGLLFHLLGMVHPRLRTGMLPREVVNKRNKTIALRIGHVIPYERLEGIADDRALMDYLRLRTYHLRRRSAAGSKPVRRTLFPLRVAAPPPVPVAPAQPVERLKAEVAGLPAGQRLIESGAFSVCYAEAREIPHVLQEIGRLREATFRAVGEGTGRACDVDAFDDYYLHLFVWNHEKGELVGAYRLGQTDAIVRRLGVRGLYTSTLFRYRRKLLDRMGPALEMGRSFVREEYQKNFSPLLLLWKGVALFVARHPRYKTLFGPVSVNNDYQTSSRQLLVAFLRMNNFLPELARLVRPRRPLRTSPLEIWRLRRQRAVVNDLAEVESLIADVETELKGVPVLLRQYLRLGGRLLGFNVDPAFGNCLDGLILVDLTRTEPALLAKYMGREETEKFLAYHRAARGTPGQG